MEQKREAIIALHNVGKRPCEIVSTLKAQKVSRKLVYRTLKRYSETGSTRKRHGGGWKLTATGPANVRKVREQIRRNPRRSARSIAKRLRISEGSVRTILKKRLNTFPYKLQKVQELTQQKKATRLKRARALMRRHASGDLKNIVFSDEKLFTIQQVVNKQNDRVWAKGRSSIDSDSFRVTRTQGVASVMVWAGITATGRTPLVFVPENAKINARMYLDLILNGCLKPWAETQFSGIPWVFQQDSAPAHKARTTQAWLQANVPGFISTSEWPPYSPDLNPMDFCIWSILENKVCATRHSSVNSLKNALLREWGRIPQSMLRDSIDAFGKRLRLVVQARGGYIEN